MSGELKPPLVALLFTQELLEMIATGQKTITIREGYRDYQVGRPVICFCDPWGAMAEIESVRHCKLSEITKEEWEKDGFLSQQDLLEGMRGFYPTLTMDSPMTVITFKNAKGKFVDELKAVLNEDQTTEG